MLDTVVRRVACSCVLGCIAMQEAARPAELVGQVACGMVPC